MSKSTLLLRSSVNCFLFNNLILSSSFSLFLKGLVYTITDVPDLFDWMKKHFTEHPLFEAVCEDELV